MKRAWLLCLGMSNATLASPKVPPTRSEPVVDVLHGQAVPDPFRWLENDGAPEVQAWMKAQDEVTRAALAKVPQHAALEARLKALLYVDAISAPVERAGRLFYTRRRADQEKAVLYWRPSANGAEKVLLDPNSWQEHGEPVSLGEWFPSWDGRKLAFHQRPNAADESTLRVMDVDTGQWSEVDVIPGAKYANPSWTPDNRAFYYEGLPVGPAIPDADRPGFIETRLHVVGTAPSQDALVHPKLGDPTTFLQSDLSRDGKYLFFSYFHGWLSNDVYIQRPGQDATWMPIVRGTQHRYDVGAWKDQLYIRTDEGAARGRIFRTSAAHPEREHWQELVAEDPAATLIGFRIAGGHLVLSYLKNAASELRVTDLNGGGTRTVPLPALGSVDAVVGQKDSDDVYFDFTSYAIPRRVFHLSAKSGQVTPWALPHVPVDADATVVEQVWYPSKDGTRISMFLVHRKGLKRDGQAPALLYGYGGFDVSLTPAFRALIHPWLEAGGVYAEANLRGGGEYGQSWHEAGMRQRKQNVFDDFIGAGEYLVREGYTRSSRLAIRGGSNGGLLVGAAMTQRPDLFGAVLCHVPLLDMIRFHKFGGGMTWTPEYGNPDSGDDFPALWAYSPYHRVRRGVAYPPLLMFSADHDDRVAPLHARKFVAQVQTSGRGPAPAYLRVERNAGHGGADQLKAAAAEGADELAFLFQTFGL